jgi:hypothetical protein
MATRPEGKVLPCTHQFDLIAPTKAVSRWRWRQDFLSSASQSRHPPLTPLAAAAEAEAAEAEAAEAAEAEAAAEQGPEAAEQGPEAAGPEAAEPEQAAAREREAGEREAGAAVCIVPISRI